MPALSDAERQQHRRQRRAAGRCVLAVEVELFAVVDRLVETGLLQAWDSEDKTKIAEALSEAIAVWCHA